MQPMCFMCICKKCLLDPFPLCPCSIHILCWLNQNKISRLAMGPLIPFLCATKKPVIFETFYFLELFFIYSIYFYLHFKWFPLFWLPTPQKSHKPSSLPLFPHLLLPTSLFWYCPILLHWDFLEPGATPQFFLDIIWCVDYDLGNPSF